MINVFSIISGIRMTAEKVARLNDKHRSILLVSLDIIISAVLFGASPNNYYYFGFYDIPYHKRKTYVTHRFSEKIIKQLNSSDNVDLFERKELFNKTFNKFIKRKYVYLEETSDNELREFFDNLNFDKKCIYKPVYTAQGQGIEVINLRDFDEFKSFVSNHDSNAIIEQWIDQHDSLKSIYEKSVNCIRIITITSNAKTSVVAANITFGNDSDIANASQMGLVCLPNINTGVVETDAYDVTGIKFENHPFSGVKFNGFQIPFWDRIIQTAVEAANVVNNVGYIGWDFAVSNDGPIIIEGNTTPGYKFFQLNGLLPNHIGNKHTYLKAIKR